MSEQVEDNFKAGVKIVSGKANYTIVELIGEGKFGAAYLVKDAKSKQYVMKVERKVKERKHARMKMEIAVLKLVNGKHLPKIVDRGKKEKDGFFFLVMELVGKCLSDLKADRAEKVFSFVTGLGVANQCLEAVEELHKYGFIHRDLKPQNYACGLDEKKHLIYILNFEIARKYMNKEKNLKTPRAPPVAFKGTVRFAPLAGHKSIEMAPKDDVESWFYLLIDLILVGGLPWRKLNDKNEVLKMKEECRKEKRSLLYTGMKQTSELNEVLDYIDSRAYEDRLDYQFIYKSLAEACTATGMDIDSPYDWETTKEKEREGTSAEKSK